MCVYLSRYTHTVKDYMPVFVRYTYIYREREINKQAGGFVCRYVNIYISIYIHTRTPE